MPELTQLENVVQSTTNYDQFSLLDTNRTIYQRHVQDLVKSIEESGNLTQVTPILVNGRLQVIDGQHRLEACKQLGLPIYYTVVPGATIDTARAMNRNQKNWKPEDYARSYAEEGNTQYQRYWQLREDYPSFRHSIILVYCYPDAARTKTMGSTFRNGEFEITDEALTRQYLDKFAEINERLPETAGDSRTMARSILFMLKTPGYNHERMLRKLSTLSNRIHKFTGIVDQLRNFEEVYNDNLSLDSNQRLRFV